MTFPQGEKSAGDTFAIPRTPQGANHATHCVSKSFTCSIFMNDYESHGLPQSGLAVNRIYHADCLEGMKMLPAHSVDMFLFMVQAFTGALLAFNYAPTPGDAYNSLRYILTELTGGRLMRGLHHWGASMIIVVVVLHMVQVFLYGAYKKPREA